MFSSNKSTLIVATVSSNGIRLFADIIPAFAREMN
jgi:hypothetical protein